LWCPCATCRWGCHNQSGLCQNPSARWRWDLPRALKSPKHQVVLRSALLKGRAAQAPGVLMSIVPVPGARSSWPATPSKLVLIIFFSTIPSMSNTSQRKDNPILLPLPLQLFVLRARLSLYCYNPQCFISTRCHAHAKPRACALSWVCEKNHKKIIWKKTVAIHNIFKEKTTKLNSQTTKY